MCYRVTSRTGGSQRAWEVERRCAPADGRTACTSLAIVLQACVCQGRQQSAVACASGESAGTASHHGETRNVGGKRLVLAETLSALPFCPAQAKLMGSYSGLISGGMEHGFTLLTGSPTLRMEIGVRAAFEKHARRCAVAPWRYCALLPAVSSHRPCALLRARRAAA